MKNCGVEFVAYDEENYTGVEFVAYDKECTDEALLCIFKNYNQ